MKTSGGSYQSRPVLTQTEKNTTLWVGHLQNEGMGRFGGQTFTCPDSGQLDNIQVYSAAVHKGGEITLTLHEFNETEKTWGPPLATASLKIAEDDTSKWISFALQPATLVKDRHYGFQLQSNNGMIGLGEADTGTREPFTFGHQWHANTQNEKGHFFSYFSLAFKIELRA
jgi:hypothetical protein